jgi:hypothetical protein
LLNVCFKKINLYETWILKRKQDINNVYLSFKEIDERGMFESDDYVGTIFKEMVSIIDEFNKAIQ